MLLKEMAYQNLDKLINNDQYYWGSPGVSVMLWLYLTILNTDGNL